MKILHKPTATVGQIVKDLEVIVSKNPAFIFYDCINFKDLYVKGVRLQNDLAVMETTPKRHLAVTAEQLLSVFSILDASTGVVMQNGWKLLDITPSYLLGVHAKTQEEYEAIITKAKEDGTILWYDEERNFCWYGFGGDVRLVSTQQIKEEIEKRCGSGDLACKLVPVSKNPRRGYHVNCLQLRYGTLCLCYDKSVDRDSIKLETLQRALSESDEFAVLIGGKFHTVEIGEEGIFFGIKNKDERYIGIHLGEVVYDLNDKSNKKERTTKKQVLEDLGRFAEKCPERRVVCIDNYDMPLFISGGDLDDYEEPWRYILASDDGDEGKMTVGRLMECLTENHPDDPDPEGKKTEVIVRTSEDDSCFNYLDKSESGIFFEHTIGNEKVIAFHPGDDVNGESD